jgi:hypothetical protein
MFLIAGWLDEDGDFPGSSGVAILKANFVTTASFTGTTVRFTSPATANGWSFSSQAATIQLGPTATPTATPITPTVTPTPTITSTPTLTSTPTPTPTLTPVLRQQVRPVPTVSQPDLLQPVAIAIVYDTDPPNAHLLGLGLRVHYDSSQLGFQTVSSVFTPGALFGAGVLPTEADLSNADGDATTDRYVLLAWADSNAEWPGIVPQQLATLNFSTGGLGDSTTVRFSAASVSPGYALDAVSATIEGSCTLDFDGNGAAAALTDGLLALRGLFGFTGASMVSGALGVNALRVQPTEIAGYMNACRSQLVDVDGNGVADALSDGILMLRFLFGFSGQSLIVGAVQGNCGRCTAGEIESFLDSRLPGP